MSGEMEAHLLAEITKRRQDPEFMARIAASIERNKPILDRLAENEEAETWIFGKDSAALLIARTSWPMENDDNRQSWSRRLTDPAERDLLDQEYRRALARLAAAYAVLVAPSGTPAGEDGGR